jgi:hypothetical protein
MKKSPLARAIDRLDSLRRALFDLECSCPAEGRAHEWQRIYDSVDDLECFLTESAGASDDHEHDL